MLVKARTHARAMAAASPATDGCKGKNSCKGKGGSRNRLAQMPKYNLLKRMILLSGGLVELLALRQLRLRVL